MLKNYHEQKGRDLFNLKKQKIKTISYFSLNIFAMKISDLKRNFNANVWHCKNIQKM